MDLLLFDSGLLLLPLLYATEAKSSFKKMHDSLNGKVGKYNTTKLIYERIIREKRNKPMSID